MSDFKLDVLKSIETLSNPYCDISDLNQEHDKSSEKFTHAFTQLRKEGYIKSDLPSCGLSIGGDGTVRWSSCDLYVTEKGKNTLSPPKPQRESIISWLIKPAIVASLIGLIFWITPRIYEHYNKADKKPEEISHKTNQ